MRRRDLTHMQLLTLPINSQDPDPADICHGRNSLVHKATRSAVPVSGRDTAVRIKSGADRDPESSEFIMPGLQVYHCTNSISRHLLPTKALIEDTVFEIRVAKWSSATLGIWKLFCCYLCKHLAHFHDLEQAISTPSLQVFFTGETKNRVFVLRYC